MNRDINDIILLKNSLPLWLKFYESYNYYDTTVKVTHLLHNIPDTV